MPYILQNRRAAIVVRDKHGAAQIGVSAIKNAGELTFALSFLLNHFAYKRSKAHGLRFQTIVEIAGAMKVAYDEFDRKVVDVKEASAEEDNGRIADVLAKTNPYNFINRDDEDDD